MPPGAGSEKECASWWRTIAVTSPAWRGWETAYGKVGTLICWDQWFPEGARLTAMAGAQVLFYPTAIGWHPTEKAQYGEAQHDSWELMMRSHGVANGCYVCAPNRIQVRTPSSQAASGLSSGRPQYQ